MLLINCTTLEAEGSKVEEDGTLQLSKDRVMMSYFIQVLWMKFLVPCLFFLTLCTGLLVAS